MSESDIERIIVKYLNREADISELEKLDIYLRDKKNLVTFNHFVRTEYLTTIGMAEYDVDKAKKAVRQKLANIERKGKVLKYRRIAVAASIVLLVGAVFFKWEWGNQGIRTESLPPIAIEAGSNKAILTLEDGNQVALEKGKQYRTGRVKSDGSEIVYNSSKEKIDPVSEPRFNYLTIPRGGQFFVQLADGTQVWLNSESKLKYPIEFQKGKMRSVELLYGEAYFKVSPSSEHNGSEFHVYSKFQEIGVLGTEFNIRAYAEEDVIATTLVEGKINIQKNGINKILKPNQQSKVHSDTDSIGVAEVDVSQEISWVKGLFTFNEETLDEIMMTLSRWYDVEVIFENAGQKKFVFTGIIERTESVNHILKLIEATSEGQLRFEISDNKIIVK